MLRACFVFASVLGLALTGFSLTSFAQSNSQAAQQVPGAPTPPALTKEVRDSVAHVDSLKLKKGRKSKAKLKAAAADSVRAKAAADSAKAKAVADSSKSGATVKPASSDLNKVSAQDTGKAAKDTTRGAAKATATDTTHNAASAPAASESDKTPLADEGPKNPNTVLAQPKEAVRAPPDLRLFNNPPLIGREYGFGILGSVVSGALCFFIGSGLETAIEGESASHKGTLSFTGIRYDNYYGAFWGGATGLVLGSSLTTYFIGQTEEEDGGLFMTLLGTTAATSGALYLAHLMGVNDHVGWTPYLPILAVPTLGGTLGFNLSRWWSDHEREKTVSHESAALYLHAPRLAWGRDADGQRLEIHALNLTF